MNVTNEDVFVSMCGNPPSSSSTRLSRTAITLSCKEK